MDKKTLYKIDSKGKTRVWSVWVEDNGDWANIGLESGLLDGKKVTQYIAIREGKNVGKVNETTPYSQACSEAQSKITQQLRSGYVEDLSQVRDQGTLGSGLRSPMLAQKYHPTGAQKGSKTLAKMKLEGKKIHVQPKLDGNRCLVVVGEEGATMYTRKGDVMQIQFEQILNEITECYNNLFTGVAPPLLTLDGELFSTTISFNTLNGLLNRKDCDDLSIVSEVTYNVYDLVLDETYDQRYAKLEAFLSASKTDKVKLIPSYEIVATDDNIKEKLEEFLAEGHEGLMIRTLDKGYENKRSWQLVKVKLFEDFEAKLLDVELDAMNRLGAFVMEMPTETKDRYGKPVTTFRAGTTGLSHAEGLAIVENKEEFIGTMCTIECFGFSEYGVPRFPKMKQLNRRD